MTCKCVDSKSSFSASIDAIDANLMTPSSSIKTSASSAPSKLTISEITFLAMGIFKLTVEAVISPKCSMRASLILPSAENWMRPSPVKSRVTCLPDAKRAVPARAVMEPRFWILGAIKTIEPSTEPKIPSFRISEVLLLRENL